MKHHQQEQQTKNDNISDTSNINDFGYRRESAYKFPHILLLSNSYLNTLIPRI
jgi:flagellar basal body rod protein FlgG